MGILQRETLPVPHGLEVSILLELGVVRADIRLRYRDVQEHLLERAHVLPVQGPQVLHRSHDSAWARIKEEAAEELLARKDTHDLQVVPDAEVLSALDLTQLRSHILQEILVNLPDRDA